MKPYTSSRRPEPTAERAAESSRVGQLSDPFRALTRNRGGSPRSPFGARHCRGWSPRRSQHLSPPEAEGARASATSQVLGGAGTAPEKSRSANFCSKRSGRAGKLCPEPHSRAAPTPSLAGTVRPREEHSARAAAGSTQGGLATGGRARGPSAGVHPAPPESQGRPGRGAVRSPTALTAAPSPTPGRHPAPPPRGPRSPR